MLRSRSESEPRVRIRETDAIAEAATLWQASPAGSWKDASALGDGSLGALVYGGAAMETVLLNHEALWAFGSSPQLPDVSALLPQVRNLFDRGEYAAANALYPDALKAAGYNARCSAFVPGPDLLLRESVEGSFSKYVRKLDCAQALVSVEWLDGGSPRGRDYFVSSQARALVIRCRSAQGQPLRRTLGWRIHDLLDSLDKNLKAVDLQPQTRTHAYADGLGFEAHLSEGYAYCAAVQVRGAEHCETDADGTLSFTASGDVLLLVRLAPLEDGAGGAGDLYRSLTAVAGDYEHLLAEHLAAHQSVFGALQLDLGASAQSRAESCETLLARAYEGEIDTALVEKLFYFGRYLLHCSSRPGTLPAHLQGVWNGDYSPPWRSAYFNNENLQMSYWQALPGNLCGSLLPVFALYERMWADFRENARAFFGCRGLLLPLYLSPDCGLQKDLQPHVLYWTGAGAWLAQLYWEYWLFTADAEFLRTRALPFMEEVALFYEDFIVIDEAGRAKIYPGNSPENHPLLDNAESNIDICENATMDVALVRELFSNLIEAQEVLGIACGQADKRRRLLDALPRYEANGEGAFKEWLHPAFGDNYNHRHLSHIYPFFPGHEITAESDPEGYAAIVTAVNKRLRIGIGEQTGWSLVHLANIFARFGDAERATECFTLLAKSCVGPNLFTYHNDFRGMGLTMPMRWGLTPPLQLDANFGFPAAVLEMLLYSASGRIRVLPALPAQWGSGQVRGLLARGGIRVALAWNCESGALQIVLRSERQQRIRLGWPEMFGFYAEAALPGMAEIELPARQDVSLNLVGKMAMTNI